MKAPAPRKPKRMEAPSAASMSRLNDDATRLCPTYLQALIPLPVPVPLGLYRTVARPAPCGRPLGLGCRPPHIGCRPRSVGEPHHTLAQDGAALLTTNHVHVGRYLDSREVLNSGSLNR